MIDLRTARGIAAAYLREGVRNSCRWSASIQDRLTREHDFGWVFFYQSPEFIATGDVRSSLISNAPLIVDRRDGWISWTGTAYDISVYETGYRRWRNDRQRRERSEGIPHSSWLRKLNGARARRLAEEYLGAGTRTREGITPVITPDPPRGPGGPPRSEFPFGWIFEWDSNEYLETRDPRFLVCGQGDLVVLRDSGKVFETGNAYRPSDYLTKLLTDGRLRPQEGKVFEVLPWVGLTRNISPYLSISLYLGSEFVAAESIEEISRLSARSEADSKGIILGHRTGSVGHTFNFVREGEGIDLVDVQIGRRAWMEKPFERIWYGISRESPDGRKPLELDSARALAQTYLDVMPKDDGVEIIVTGEQPTDLGWLFFYRSKEPMDDDDLREALCNEFQPVAVDRSSHRVVSIGPGMQAWTDRSIEEMRPNYSKEQGSGSAMDAPPPRSAPSATDRPALRVWNSDGNVIPWEDLPRELKLTSKVIDELHRRGVLPPPDQDIVGNTTGVIHAIVSVRIGQAIDNNIEKSDEEIMRIAVEEGTDELDRFRRGAGTGIRQLKR